MRPRTLFLVLSLLLALAWSASAASAMPAQFLPGDDVIGPAASDQLAPDVAAGGDLLLAAWGDERAFPSGASFYDYETSSDIYGMRLDASGNLLDDVPFVISQAPGSQENPKIAWNGANWLVVFESYAISGTGYYYEKSLEAVRVTPAGQVLDTTPIRIFGAVPFTGSWAVASDGLDWAVAFEGSASSSDLQAVRITAAGAVELPSTSLVDSTYYLRFNLRLAYAGGVYLLAWDEFYDTAAIRFDQNITPLDTTPITLLTGTTVNDLASNGSQFYIVWPQQQPNFTTAVTGSRVSTDGVKLDGNGVNISGPNQPQAYTTTNVAWDGAYWKVTWGYNNAVRLARVNSVGQVVDPGGIAISGPSTGPSAATSTAGIQLVWAAYVSYQNDVVSANISASNVAGPNQTLGIGGPMQVRPDVAVGSSGYMAVYSSYTGSTDRVLAQPLDANGLPLTAGPIQLDSGDNLYGPGAPKVAWNGSLYLVTWANSSGIVAQRIQQDGTLVDAAPFLVIDGIGSVDVAAVGDTFLVVGHQIGFNIQYIFPVAARVRGIDGVVLDPTPITLGGSYVQSIAVTTFGGRWLAAWQQNFTHDDPLANTMAAFVNTDGTHGNEFSVNSYYSTAGGNGIFEVSVAASDNVALVVQSQELSSGVETDLRGRLINADGSMQALFNLTPWVGNQYRPRAAWDGSQFLVVYNEQKNRFAPWTLDQLDARSDLFGMRISEAGVIIDPQGFAFSTSPIGEAYPNVTAANGLAFLSASLMRNEAPYAAYRIGTWQVGAGGNDWPVAVADANTSGGDIPLTVNFSSAGSTDPDGTVSGYLWDFGDGATSTEANPSHTYTAAGKYVVTLTVTDNQGATSVNTVPIEATVPNQAPIAIAAAEPTSGPAPLDVTFFAEGSYDPDGSIGNIRWAFSDGGEYWGSTAYHTFYQAGTWLVTLTVYDNRGATGTTTLTIEVLPPNQAPVAVATADPTSGDPPLTVNFTGSGSYDPDGAIVSYHWNFGDGGSSAEANPSHVYTSGGQYIATLTVTDNWGDSNSTQVTIDVTCVSQCLRSSNITLTARRIGSSVQVTGKVYVVTETGARVKNALVYVTWTLPGGYTVDLSVYTNNQGIATFSTSSGRGTYTLTVTNITKAGYQFDPANSILSKSITK
ncbi:MAG: PKD domain-containing protein [Chloroflexota bacterium]